MNIKMAEEYLNPTNIKVVGVGGGGCNAVNRMIEKGFSKVEFIALNTDIQALASNKAETKIQIGAKITKGLGAGANPDVGEKAALESKDTIVEALKNSNMVFITAGMGGGTGTGAAPMVAKIAKEMNILTVAVVTKPFDFEGTLRFKKAQEGIAQLEKTVDSLIIIPNQKLIDVMDDNFTLMDSFSKVDDILRQGIQGIAEIIKTPGLINVDFADVQAIMQGAGTSIMGIGLGAGKDRAMDAVEKAVLNPLLEMKINGAKGILVNVSGGNNLTIAEYNKILTYITKNAHPDANIIAGALIDEKLQDHISVTLIATNFTHLDQPKSFSKGVQQETVTIEPTLLSAPSSNFSKSKDESFHKRAAAKVEEKEQKILKNPSSYINFSDSKDSLFGISDFYGKEEMHKIFEEDFSSKIEDLETPSFLRKNGGFSLDS